MLHTFCIVYLDDTVVPMQLDSIDRPKMNSSASGSDQMHVWTKIISNEP